MDNFPSDPICIRKDIVEACPYKLIFFDAEIYRNHFRQIEDEYKDRDMEVPPEVCDELKKSYTAYFCKSSIRCQFALEQPLTKLCEAYLREHKKY